MAASCKTAKKATSYTVALKYADKEDIESDHKITLVENINNVVATSYLYEDDMLSILWNVDTDVFAFALENKSDHTMEIPWDDMVYFDWKGDEQRVIQKNVKYVNRNLPQTPTIVPKDSTVAEYLLPVVNIYTTSGFFNSSYTIKSLLPSYKSQYAADKSNLVGQTIKIKFPVVVDGSRKEYLFAFQIENVLVEKQ